MREQAVNALLSRDPNGIYPATRQELIPVAFASCVLAFLALMVCATHGWLLLYGDAVAHLGIARRIVDARYPGLAQLGGVWLPLPHLLMVPFIGRMEWWQNGLAGAWPSMASFVLAVMGLYRLARRVLPITWSMVATLFFALNPNLLYLSTTAMTEPLFLALLLWTTAMTVEAAEALAANRTRIASARMIAASVLIFCMVMTRYDGWIMGAVAWLMIAVAWWRAAADTRRRTTMAFAITTLITVAGPLLWFWYNARYEGDWLDFMRGPYSPAAIEKRTSPPGSKHYRGWHNPGWSLLFYTRTAQVDAAAWETGFALMAASLWGAWVLWKRRVERLALLLWIPLPFYVYSVAWGSVPIFIPQLYPHSYYNARYGMEMLPAFALCGTLAMAWLDEKMRTSWPATWPGTGAKWADRIYVAVLLAVFVNTAVMMGAAGLLLSKAGLKLPRWVGAPPLVFDEAVVNSRTRIPFEQAIARQLEMQPAGTTIMMDTTDHIGAVQDAGIPLKQLISPLDSQRFNEAKDAPARHASLVVAMDHDAVARAVAAHPEGLTELEIICLTGQPCARFYQSSLYLPKTGGAAQ